jgi:hypothetical protein
VVDAAWYGIASGGAHRVHLGIEAGHVLLNLALQHRRLQAPQFRQAVVPSDVVEAYQWT